MDASNNNQKEKLSTLGELAAVLAHEIKNPMNSIMINVETLRSTISEMSSPECKAASDRAIRYVNVIDGEMKRLAKVISGFLDLAAPQEPTRVKFNLNQVIHNLLDLMRLELKQKNVQIQLELDEHLPSFVGSPDQLKQSILNLVINAIQAMPEGGDIKIFTGHDTKTIFVRVRDTGPGIAEDILGNIFSPYFTTKEQGSGLGLAIVRRIVRESGGYVEVKSEVGVGTEFTLVFPRALEEVSE